MPRQTTSLEAVATIGIDIGKNSFHVVGLDERGAIVLRQKWSRSQVEAFRDAEAIAEAVQRPTMKFVATKTADQLDLQALHRVRERLVRQRTGIINQIRAFLLERGIAVRQGLRSLRAELPGILATRCEVLSARMVHLIEGLAGAAGDADMQCDGHRLFQKYQREAKRRANRSCEGPLPRRGTPRPPVQNRPRWQVSRLAEQGFPFDPRLPDPQGISGFGHLSGHGRGGGCFSNTNLPI